MSDLIPTLREYGTYLESLEQPLDIDALVAEGSARRSGSATPAGRADQTPRDVDVLVLPRDEGAAGDHGSSPGERIRHRRSLIAVAAVVVVALLIAAIVLVEGTRDDHIRTGPAGTGPAPTSTTTAPPTTSGLAPSPGLLPEGAPSAPHTGELVAAWWSHASAGEDAWFYVYADGRVIWYRYSLSPDGWLEQRLTPDGVALVRAEILSGGLFDPDQPPRGSELGLGFPFYGDIEVRNHDRLVYVPGRQDQVWTNEFDRLHERLRNLDSWLPTSAWEDPTIRPYVPSTYAICLSTSTSRFENQPPIEPSSILPLLPAPAGNLLGGAGHWRWEGRASQDPAISRRVGPSPLTPGNPHCFDVTTDEARAITQALDDAGIEHGNPGPSAWSFNFDAPDPVSRVVSISFAPHLPHGVPALTGG